MKQTTVTWGINPAQKYDDFVRRLSSERILRLVRMELRVFRAEPDLAPEKKP